MEPGLWNKLYRRKLLDGIEMKMDITIRINEDLLMNYYLFNKAEKSVFEDVCLYHYILRADSIANAKVNIRQLEDQLKVKRILLHETEQDPGLHRMVGNQMVRHLVKMATIRTPHNGPEEAAVRRQAKRELITTLRQILLDSSVSLKYKLMGIWVAIWPMSYRLVHEGYKRIKGNHTIYERKE